MEGLQIELSSSYLIGLGPISIDSLDSTDGGLSRLKKKYTTPKNGGEKNSKNDRPRVVLFGSGRV